MSNVFRDLKPKNHIERNGFDLSRRSVFSTKVGMILPVFNQPTLPNSEYKIDVRQLLRTQPLQTAAFTGFSVNYDFFFVPNNYSYTSFNEFIAQREDPKHVGQPNYRSCPRFKFKPFMQTLLCCAIYDYMLALFFRPYGYDANPNMSVNTLPPYILGVSQSPWASVSLECVRALDMFGYGNFLPFVKKAVNIIINDSSFGGNPSSFTNLHSKLESVYNAVTGLTVTLNSPDKVKTCIYGILSQTSNANGLEYVKYGYDTLATLPDLEPTLWPFLAYNKGFSEFYRNSFYDFQLDIFSHVTSWVHTFHYSYEYVQLFNVDDFGNLWILGSYDIEDEQHLFLRLVSMMFPKYHLYKKDLFTGVLPSTQFGDVSVMVTDDMYRAMQAEFPYGPTFGPGSTGSIAFENTSSSVTSEGLYLNCVCFPLPSVPSITNNFPILLPPFRPLLYSSFLYL